MPLGPNDNPLGISDEEFSQLVAPPAAPAADEGDQGSGDEGAGTTDTQDEVEGSGEGADTSGDDDTTDAGDDTVNASGEDDVDEAGEKSKEGDNLPQDKSLEQGKPDDKKADEPKDKDGNPVPGSKPEGQDSPPDYKALYEGLMAPLRANGKTIELKSPEELKQLAQMGANYTRKMQALAPHRKLLLMLENNGLLSEDKLSFLIDIDKKSPDAIKKLLKDANIDPIDIDIKDESTTYREGNHRVSDEEAGFRTTLDELSSNPEGRETLQLIHTQWDQASKELLWKEPEVMSLIHQHREDGIYALIQTEMDRRRTLGAIPPNATFLQAYKTVGDELAQAGAFAQLGKGTETKPPATHVATRKATPKPAATNADKANAASTSRANSRKAESSVNPLAVSDEDFMKQVAQFEGRV